MFSLLLKLILYSFLLFFVCVILYLPIMAFELVRRPPRRNSCRVWFGRPGSGKSTFCACFAHKYLKKGIPVYSNVPITDAYEITINDIGVYKICDGYVIIDEAGIDYNNRQVFQGRAMSPSALEWWKKIRHEGCLADIFSQSFEDMDIVLRRLSGDIFIVKKSLFPKQFVAKRIPFKPDVDNLQHKIVDFYKMGLPVIDTYRVYGPKYWKFFDSYDRMDLPVKEFKIYGGSDNSKTSSKRFSLFSRKGNQSDDVYAGVLSEAVQGVLDDAVNKDDGAKC